MDYLSDRLKFDVDIYDKKPRKNPRDYIQGFCTFAYFPLECNSLHYVEDRLNYSNAMAIFPSNYQTEDEDGHPYIIAYIMHESLLERSLFNFVQKKQFFKFKSYSDDPVFFHKGWLRSQYVPQKNAGWKARHGILANNRCFAKSLPPEIVREIFYQYDIHRKCYEPKSCDTDMCTRKKQPGDKYVICSDCLVSDIYGRYGRGRACVV